ncbi:MAG: flavodoxin [Corynebacterium sp.]|nr:flavodoxin [Corynebacterium sp.]
MSTSPYLVAYFSATGTTEAIAHRVAEAVDAELFHIQPEVPYVSEDLGGAPGTRAADEQREPDTRPATNGQSPALDGVEIMFLGYPLWFGVSPRIILSFLEENKEALKGITIMPFATSGDSDIAASIGELHHHFPELDIQDGPAIHPGEADRILASWLQ